jgi:internalin A
VSDLEPLQGLTSLQNLNCHSTQVSSLEPLRGLTSLQSLNCSYTQVSDLEPLRALTSLKELNCSNTPLSSLNITRVSSLEPLRGLTSLKELNCFGTKVSDLEPLRGLASLQNLNCSGTKVSHLEPLRGLTSLKVLNCGAERVSDLEPLRGLTSLEKLGCAYSLVSDLTPLQGLVSLKLLNCTDTPLTNLELLQGLVNLEEFVCSRTEVSSLEPLKDLTSLKLLHCDHTQVSSLEPLRSLVNLTTLNCGNTQVSDLAPLRSLVNLTTLNCGNTQVSDLEPLVNLQRFRYFDCQNLKLKEFPRKLLFSEYLRRIDLNGASIPGIPEEAFSNDKDQPFTFFNNTIPALRSHVLDLEVEAIPINSVKILVLGNGGVGKTQLCRHLAAEPFDPTVLTTHGIALRTIAPATEADAIYYLWDFGGQDIYHSAHTLFMRTAAVFVVLWTPEQEAMVASDNDDEDPLVRRHPLTYWLDYVRTLGRPDSPVVVVQSQCDRPGQAVAMLPVDADLLKSFGCLSVCNFSALTRRGAASLKEALADANAYLRDRDGISSIGRGRHLVWQQLEAWRQADQQLPAQQRLHRTLSQEDFASLCKQTGGVSSSEALLRFLHNKGVVFHSPDLFHDRIILDQSWALDAVYAVFERGSTYPLIKANDGRLWPSLLAATVWREYEPEAQKLFLSLMGTCGIVFPYRQADTDLGLEAEYVAPDLLPSRSSPQVIRQLRGRWEGSDPSLTLTYTYSFLHGGLVRALLCDLGNHAGDGGVYWRYGAWMYDARQGCIALLDQQMVDDRAGTITISFQGAGSVKLADWFIKRLAERNRQFGYADLQPSCSGPLAGQVLALDKRQRLYTSSVGEASAPPPPELVPAPVEAFHKPGREVFISYAWGDASPEGKERQQIVDWLVDALRKHPEPITVHIDRDEMRPGDLISTFMDRLAAGDRVIVVISDKYLRSEYCMYELFKIYQNCRNKAEDFQRRIIPVILPDAGLSGGTAARLKPAEEWDKQRKELEAIFVKNPDMLGVRGYKKYRLICEFSRNTFDMLDYLLDQLQPRDYDRQMEGGFPELCEQILAD